MAKNTNVSTEPLIKIIELKKHFPLKKTKLFQKEVYSVKANDGITLTIHKGETLGLVGESGCGKSTLGRVLLQLYAPTSGKVLYYGYQLAEFAPKYYLQDIKKLSEQQKEHTALLKSIEDTKATIAKIQNDSAINAKKAELKTKIEVINADNKKIYDECIEKCGTFITLNDLKTVNTFRKFDTKIASMSEKLAKLKTELANLEAKKQHYDTNLDQGIVDKIEALKSQLTEGISKKNSDIEKEISILERKLKAPSVDVQLQINKIKGNIHDVERTNSHFISLVKGSLENPSLDINSEILNKLVDYKLVHRKNELEIQNYQDFIDDKKYYDQIDLYTTKAEKLYRNASRCAGGLILYDNIQLVEDELFKNINLKGEFKKIKTELTALDVSKYRLEQKKEKNSELTDYQVELIDKKIAKIQNKIDVKNKEINVVIENIKVSEDAIKDLNEKCKDHPEYEALKEKRERGIDLARLTKEELRTLRQDLQIIFQDPYSSLNPRMTVGQIIGEGISAHNLDKLGYDDYQTAIEKVMEKCGLAPYMIHRYPHQFSGGQRQRIGIARALVLNPKFVVCDEAVSALDVSIQSQIINLLEDLRDNNNLTYLFISHDLSVIKHISNRIGVMYLGNLVELAESEEMYQNPLHPYTKALISAIPTTDQGEKKRIILEGDIPSNVFPPSGCKFRTRCPIACKECAKKVPELREVEPGRFVACHFYEKTKDIQAN